jgi:pimeloyl-ACP methyl ester carboxylesterase
MTMTSATTRTLEAPGATITYDVRPGGSDDIRPLFMIGSPMAAAGFGTLAGHFLDRTVITYDPRGSERSTKTDPARATPEQHLEDLHRIIAELGGGPVDMFASSGGAINALGLVATHPDDIEILVAHEPPMLDVLPDAAAARAASLAVHETYMRSGFGAGMAHFMALTSHTGPIPDDWAAQPAPDPAMFGLPTEDDGSRNDPLLGQDESGVAYYRLDFDAVRAAATRVIIGAGVESEGQLAYRCAVEVARRLGSELVIFPSHHGGFLGGEYGWPGDPDAFAAKLRDVLAAER